MDEKQFMMDMQKDSKEISNETLMKKYNFKTQKEMFAKFSERREQYNIKSKKISKKDAKDFSEGMKQMLEMLK